MDQVPRLGCAKFECEAYVYTKLRVPDPLLVGKKLVFFFKSKLFQDSKMGSLLKISQKLIYFLDIFKIQFYDTVLHFSR